MKTVKILRWTNLSILYPYNTISTEDSLGYFLCTSINTNDIKH